MVNITVSLPDAIAQQYYNASEKISDQLKGLVDSPPDAQTLMRFMLAGFSSDDIARHFDFALRNLVGAPIPGEDEVWVFPPQFDDAP